MILRNEAMLMLEKRGAVLETARRVSSIFRDAKIDAAIIGGIAVFLHGYERTTIDVDVFIPGSMQDAARALKTAGLKFDARRREFYAGKVPVQLIDAKLAQPTPKSRSEIDEVATISLADLINLKLRSGSGSVKRTQDIADVIGLIRANRLTKSFVPKIAKDYRPEFRKLVDALADD